MSNPMYRQIAEDLRWQIESGQLEPGQQLPTEIELRERYRASRNTVRDAIKWLTTLGLVETKPGQGTFLVEKIEPLLATLSADPITGLGGGEGVTYVSEGKEQARAATNSEPQVEIQKAPSEIATQLHVSEGAQVVSRHQRRYIDGTLWSLQTSFYPMGFVLKGADRLIQADDIREGTVTYLARALGLRQTGYRDWIKVRAPASTEASYFKLPQDGRVGVFEIFRTAFDQTGTPMRLTVTVFPTDRNQFIVNVGEMPDSGFSA
jgi:GntR family transcriptional regulator